MCSKWSKPGRNASKMAQKGSKGAKRCQNGPKGGKTGNEGVREGQNGGRGRAMKRKKVMNSLFAHPFPCKNGLLSTLSGKRWTKRPFSGGSSSQCEALRAFSTLWGHFGSFWVILGHFRSFWGLLGPPLLSRESAKSHGNGPLGRSKMLKNSKSDPLVLCGVHFE